MQPNHATLLLPMPLAVGFQVAHRAHTLWRWNRDFQDITRSRTNAAAFGAGMAVEWASRVNPLIHFSLGVAGKVVLVGRCIIDCTKQYHSLCEKYNDWIQVITCKRVVHIDPENEWNLFASFALIDPTTGRWASLQLQITANYVAECAKCTFVLFAQFFHLSNSVIALIEAHSIDEKSVNESIDKLFLNIKLLYEEKEQLAVILENQKPLVKEFLSYIQVPYSTENMINSLHKSVELGDKAEGLLSHPVVAVVIKIGKEVKKVLPELIKSMQGIESELELTQDPEKPLPTRPVDLIAPPKQQTLIHKPIPQTIEEAMAFGS